MSSPTTQHSYSIKEAAALTGLPASTLRYYESIGVIARIGRGESSKHRIFTEADLDQVLGVACLSATGMSVSDMRQYVTNSALGPEAAMEQVKLLQARGAQLAVEAEQIALRQRYVGIKVDYWQAVATGDDSRIERLANEGRALASELTRAKKP